jgi:hypothetical protein
MKGEWIEKPELGLGTRGKEVANVKKFLPVGGKSEEVADLKKYHKVL